MDKLKICIISLLFFSFNSIGQITKDFIGKQDFIGKWDLQVSINGKNEPSWLEVKQSGDKALVGYFVGHTGSARPISEVFLHDGIISFSIPSQWDGFSNMYFQGTLKNRKLVGTILSSEGGSYAFQGVVAPKLNRSNNVKWGIPKSLFNNKNLQGWHTSEGQKFNQWIVENGILKNPKSGVNLISDQNYNDFKLHIEVRYPKGSNSGIYLRGRYEVQVEDGYGKDPDSILFGGIYGFLTPNQMAALPAGEWQLFDITLIGRRVTIEANGKKIITDQIIPGITGGALDSNEGLPGPIMLQGDHGLAEYRNIRIQIGK